MYPDLITPRAHPDLLARVDYDPYNLMPAELPAAPSAFATAAQLAAARQRVAAGSAADVDCLDRLIVACKLDEPLPELGPATKHPDWGGPLLPWLQSAFHNALAYALTDDPAHRERALSAMQLAARAVSEITDWTGHEHHEATAAARAYDLLAASGISDAEHAAFRPMLYGLVGAIDCCGHRACNNHNSMGMVARLATALALADRQMLHDTWYGCQRDGLWRYGMIHLMRHDFLADGMQWEGTTSYHMVVLVHVFEILTLMQHAGVDLWHRRWPALRQDDGFDEHRGWGPKCEKPLTAALDVLLYQMFPNGDYSRLHDQSLGNVRGTAAWWPIFVKAYEIYADARYGWALARINDDLPVDDANPVPTWLQGSRGMVEFVRSDLRAIPAGEHPLAADRQFAAQGSYGAGCTLFTVHGSAVLRSVPLDERAVCAHVYWGPHWAGHRSPAALHLDIHALGQHVTTAPHLYRGGYDEPRHLSWMRTSIAHNTVTVGEQTMFPFDFATESPWECDHWRDTLSDGQLLQYEPAGAAKIVRVSNDDVYPGMKLDRTVIVTAAYVLDIYRATGSATRQLDWSMHCPGEFAAVPDGAPVGLPQDQGYQHLRDAIAHPQTTGWCALPFTLADGRGQASIWLGTDGGASLVLADDPEPDDCKCIGERAVHRPRTCLMVRRHAAAALFVSVWGFGQRPAAGITVRGEAAGDVTVDVSSGDQVRRWLAPLTGSVGAAGSAPL
jgi:hypothetical protein